MNLQELPDLALAKLLIDITDEVIARGLYSPSYPDRALQIAKNASNNARERYWAEREGGQA